MNNPDLPSYEKMLELMEEDVEEIILAYRESMREGSRKWFDEECRKSPEKMENVRHAAKQAVALMFFDKECR